MIVSFIYLILSLFKLFGLVLFELLKMQFVIRFSFFAAEMLLVIIITVVLSTVIVVSHNFQNAMAYREKHHCTHG